MTALEGLAEAGDFDRRDERFQTLITRTMAEAKHAELTDLRRLSAVFAELRLRTPLRDMSLSAPERDCKQGPGHRSGGSARVL